MSQFGTISGHLGRRSFLQGRDFLQHQGTRTVFVLPLQQSQVGWPNGKALDYESRDCRFDPCVDQHSSSFKRSFSFALLHAADSDCTSSQRHCRVKSAGICTEVAYLLDSISAVVRRGCAGTATACSTRRGGSCSYHCIIWTIDLYRMTLNESLRHQICSTLYLLTIP